MSTSIIPAGEGQEKRGLQTRAQRSASKNPVVSYLASLSSKDSRRVQKTALDQISTVLSNGLIEDSLEFPWERLDYGTVTAVKAWLDSKYAPA
ncbi:MAG: hypothetical protein SCH68_12440, partial [Brevefilum sp.]|nr:hypothetical protein [Brevefilum sp.]